MRVVITGGPGGGKTTLLREFGRRGFATVEDTPRAIIRSRRALGLSPRPSPLEFAEQVLGRDVESYWQNSGQALTFFDPALDDLVQITI
jgi:predicted ATPase